MHFGTTIIAVVLNGSIFIGAENRMHDLSGRNLGETCKIVVVENSAAAVAGVLGDGSWRTADLARDALERPGSLAARVEYFVKELSKRMVPLLSEMRQRDASLRASEALGKPFMQSIFAEAGNSPNLIQVTLVPANDGEIKVKLRQRMLRADVAETGSYIALGHFDHCSRIVDATPNFWRTGQVPRQIRELIAIEAKENPAASVTESP